jgi:hypothetical protein
MPCSWLERPARDKYYSLIGALINLGRKKFCSIKPFMHFEASKVAKFSRI